MGIIFVTAATKDYRPALVFHSLRKLSGRVVCLLELGDRRLLPGNCQRIEYPVKGGLHQSGRFVTSIPGVEDDDVVVLVDADGIFQRDLNQAERYALENLGNCNHIAMGYNSKPRQKGWEEYALLNPKVKCSEASKRLGLTESEIKDCLVYNTGFMAAKVKAWRALADWMQEILSKNPADLFERPGWIQLLISITLHWRLPVVELGYATHSNGHFALTSKHNIVGRRLYYDDQLVLYAHNVVGVADL